MVLMVTVMVNGYCKYACLLSDIPMSSAVFPIYTPGIGTLFCMVSSVGRSQHKSDFLQCYCFFFNGITGCYFMIKGKALNVMKLHICAMSNIHSCNTAK